MGTRLDLDATQAEASGGVFLSFGGPTSYKSARLNTERLGPFFFEMAGRRLFFPVLFFYLVVFRPFYAA